MRRERATAFTPEPTTGWLKERPKSSMGIAMVGLGGGSILDIAKMASALTANPERRGFFGPGSENRGRTTIISHYGCTGSEATKHSLPHEENNVKKSWRRRVTP